MAGELTTNRAFSQVAGVIRLLTHDRRAFAAAQERAYHALEGETVMDVTDHEELLVRQIRHADANFHLLKANGVRSINVMGPVGCGKTTLMERLIERLITCGLVVGAIATAATGDTDFQRFLTSGAICANINTGGSGYLDAVSLSRALSDLDLAAIDVLFIENLPGIISPVDYPLGTSEEIVVLPLTAGSGVVSSYPRIFAQTDLLIINKIDLASVLSTSPKTIAAEYASVNPQGRSILTDALRGNGISKLIETLGFDCDGKW